MVAQVWNYFKRKEDNNDLAICDICQKEVSCKNGTTSPMNNHLKLKHKDKYDEISKKRKASSSEASVTSEKSKQPKLDLYLPRCNESTQEMVDNAIVEWLADAEAAKVGGPGGHRPPLGF